MRCAPSFGAALLPARLFPRFLPAWMRLRWCCVKLRWRGRIGCWPRRRRGLEERWRGSVS